MAMRVSTLKRARQKEKQKSNGGRVAKSRGESGRDQKLHGYCIWWRRIGAPEHVYAIFRRKLNS